MSGGPVLLGGLAYTGKTPLRIALELHPELSMTRRSRVWDRVAGRFGDLAVEENLDRCLAALAADPDVRRLEPDPATLRAAFATGPRTEARLVGLVHAQHAARRGKPRWGEQLGPVVHRADAIVDAFPDARIVHLVRDPGDRYEASPHRGPLALRRETARWREDARRARANLQTHPACTLVLRTEDLVSDPNGALEDVCAFAGLRPTDEMRAALAEHPVVAPREDRRISAAARTWIGRRTAEEARALRDAGPVRAAGGAS